QYSQVSHDSPKVSPMKPGETGHDTKDDHDTSQVSCDSTTYQVSYDSYHISGDTREVSYDTYQPLSSFLSMFSLIDRSLLPRIHSSPAGSDVSLRASMVGFWQRQRRQLRAVEAEERWAFDDGNGKINGRSHIHKSWFQRLAWASNNDGSGVGELGDGGCCVGSLVMMGCSVMAILALGSLAIADPAAPASRKANPPITASGVMGPRGDNDGVFNAWELDGGRSATAGLSP
uniref:Uncharacterized protein n=1 Tax=Oryza glaberrima TaxID=4538 RepID=I1PT35_ORYGL